MVLACENICIETSLLPPFLYSQIVQPDGASLPPAVEACVTHLANATDPDDCINYTLQLANCDIDRFRSQGLSGTLVVARDTRPSGPTLASLVIDGAVACGASVTNIGTVTTPELHYAVLSMNTKNDALDTTASELPSHLHHRYCKRLIEGQIALLHATGASTARLNTSLPIDCANGVGSLLLHDLQQDPDFALPVRVIVMICKSSHLHVIKV